MLSHLESLPNELICKILGLAARESKTLLHCEVTSKALYQVVQDDKTWESIPGVRSKWGGRFKTYRMAACARVACRSIRREQYSHCWSAVGVRHVGVTENNILVDELGVNELINLITSTIATLGRAVLDPAHLDDHDHFFLRGDTLFLLTELLQENMLVAFRKGHEFSMAVAEVTEQYPILTKQDLERYEPLVQVGKTLLNQRNLGVEEAASSILGDNPILRDCIIRRLSRRAGMARMSNEAYDFAWRSLVYFTYALVSPACVELKGSYASRNSANGKCLLASNETMRMIPPLSMAWKCECCPDGVERLHTIVPQQIEDAARSTFGCLAPCKVYGDDWLLPAGSSDALDEAIAEAEAEYEHEEDEIMEESEVAVGTDRNDDEAMHHSGDESGDESEEDAMVIAETS